MTETRYEPIAIIGIGCQFPKANDAASFWRNVREGVDAIGETPSTHWNPADYFDSDPEAPDMTYGRRGGFLDAVDFDPLEFGISPRDLEATDTSQLLGLLAAKRALIDAGYPADSEDLDRDRVSVILGVTGTLELVIPLGARLGHPLWRKALDDAGVDATTAKDVCDRIGDSYVSWQENSFPGLLGNVVAGRIANRLDLHGTNCVVDAACASSLSAVHLALLELSTGKSDMVVTGGVDTFNDIFMYMCFSKTPALSPTGDARPFAEAGDGTILGEGVGVVVLKRLADAERDGDRVYAVIRGMGSASDGKGEAIYAPTAHGQARALRDAYRNADVTPDTIGLVEAHGTGTKVGDATEIRGLCEVYGESIETGSWCALGSVKSMIGHTKAAAGAAGLIKAALALHHKVLPPTIKVDKPNEAAAPGTTPFYINTEKRPWLPSADHPRRAAVSAFGFGGSNFHCVLEEYAAPSADTPVIDWDGDVQLIALSADDDAALLEQLHAVRERLADATDWTSVRATAAESRRGFCSTDAVRLVLTLHRGGTSTADLLDNAVTLLEQNGDRAAYSAPGIDYGRGPVRGSLGAVFPGQGSQYPGMLRDLTCRFPAALHAVAEAEEATPGLSDHIYPQPAFDTATRGAQSEELRQTQVAQPAIGAVSLGALRVLRHFGVAIEGAVGHSYGELTALCAAGRLSEPDFHRLSRLRGELMAAGDGDRGAMLAVLAPVEDVEALLSDNGLDLTIANRNAPQQVVLSGATPQIDRAEAACRTAKLRCKRLPVAAAFHSPLVAKASRPFGAALAEVDISAGSFPVFANTTGTAYPSDAGAAKQLLAGQLAKPVEFRSAIVNMRAFGVSTFIEIGPGRAMTGLVDAILDGDDSVVTAALDGDADARGLARVLARIAAAGHPVALDRFDPFEASEQPAKKPAFTVPLTGANYRAPHEPRPRRAPAPPPTKPRSVPTKPVAASQQDVDPALLAEAARANRDSLAALVQMQEQTADLHRRFLDAQLQATKSLQALIAHQHAAAGLDPQLLPLATTLPTAPIAPIAPLPEPVAYQPAPAAPPPSVEPAPRPSTQPAAHSAAQPESASATASANDVADVLLEVVAEKTGYPQEMLELSMGLDADLGIDSIKRVEILSSLQERLPQAPVVKPEHLGELLTLGQIVEFLSDGDGGELVTSASERAADPEPATDSGTDYTAVLLDIVAEKTGYPQEMLELSMGLDADLGIDSIKRVEILSALQERLPLAPVVKPEHLGELLTLGHIVDFLQDGERAPEATPAATPTTPAAAPQRAPQVVRSVVQLRQVATPIDTASPLRPEARVWVTRVTDGLSSAIVAELRNRGVKADEVECTVTASPPVDLAGVVVVAPTEPNDALLHQCFALTRRVSKALRTAGERDAALFASVSRLDGQFALRGDTDEPVAELCDIRSGGLAGLTKTVGHEWPQVQATALDVDTRETDHEWLAPRIVGQILCGMSGEFGIRRSGTCTPELVTTEIDDTKPHSAFFDEDDVVVITGGARGITAEVAVALARAGSPRLLLLGRTPEPTPEPDWLRDLEDETSIKQAILEQARKADKTGNAKLTPQELNGRFADIKRNREVLRNIARIEHAGSRVAYCAVDIRDRAALTDRLQELSEHHGKITGLIHGAGVLADSYIADKSDEDFERVLATKVDGIENLLTATSEHPLKGMVMFSSSTGRFGRVGQADYAVANELLNKVAQREQRRRPGCRVLSVNWGPWDGGMVTPALRDIFAGEGIAVIDLAAGANYLLAELAAPHGPVEVVVLGGGSKLPDEMPAAADTIPSLTALPELPTVFERSVGVSNHPFLKSHVMDGKAVVPVALMIEWLAHGALHGNPGLRFRGIDDFQVFKGLILARDESVALRVCANRAEKANGEFQVDTELCSTDAAGNRTLHARARAVLAPNLENAPAPEPAPVLAPFEQAIHDVYAKLLFHGTDLKGIQGIDGCDEHGIVAQSALAPTPRDWIEQPLRSRWITDPLALDVAFQSMIVWAFTTRSVGSLPTSVRSFRQFRSFGNASGQLRIEARVTDATQGRALADIDWLDSNGELVARMNGYECVLDASLLDAFRRNTLAARNAAGR